MKDRRFSCQQRFLSKYHLYYGLYSLCCQISLSRVGIAIFWQSSTSALIITLRCSATTSGGAPRTFRVTQRLSPSNANSLTAPILCVPTPWGQKGGARESGKRCTLAACLLTARNQDLRVYLPPWLDS